MKNRTKNTQKIISKIANLLLLKTENTYYGIYISAAKDPFNTE